MIPVCLVCNTIYNVHTQFPRAKTLLVPYNKEIGDFIEEHEEFCPTMSCSGSIIRIDENMIDIVFTLNRKGYKTIGCCSSHSWTTVGEMYILFREPYEELTRNIPPMFYVKDGSKGRYIRHMGDTEYFTMLSLLSTWVKQLPSIK